MGYRCIELEDDGHVSCIRLADEATLNAVSTEMAAELRDALDRVAGSASRALLLTGKGRGFCSGANLTANIDPRARAYDAGALLAEFYNPVVLRLQTLMKPVVTAVNGPCAGFGVAIALSGDIVLAAETAYFRLAFTRIGLIPDGGASYLLVRSIGRARALELMMLDEPITASKALQWGLINRVVPAAELERSARTIATSLADGPTVALGLIRRLARDAAEIPFDEMLSREREAQKLAGSSLDHAEGIDAFRARRQPEFRGS